MAHAECGQKITPRNDHELATLPLRASRSSFPPLPRFAGRSPGYEGLSSLQAQSDQAAAAATAEQLSQAKIARDEGAKLCSRASPMKAPPS